VTGVAPASPANDDNPAFSGTAEAGSTVQLFTDAACATTATATGTADEFSSPGLTVVVADDSSTVVYATATDLAGNVSGCSAASPPFVEDSSPPDAPTIINPPTSPGSERLPQWLFDAEAGASTMCAVHSGLVEVAAEAPCSSPYTLDLSLEPDGIYTFSVAASDVAGNTSIPSTHEYVLDTTAPDAPAITTVAPASPANDNDPVFSGTAEAGSTVDLFTDDVCSAAPVASGTAAAFAAPGLGLTVADDSTTVLYATATDAAGNTSACSAGSTPYVEDSTSPDAPTITVPPTSPAADATPTWEFDIEAGASPTCAVHRVLVEVVTAATCSSPYTPDLTGQPNGTYTLTVTATDAAGNTSAATTDDYVLDSVAPDAPDITAVTPPSPANDNSPVFSGTAEDGSTVRLFTDAACATTAAATGTAAAFASPGLTVAVADDSTTVVYATASDAAGNTSACSDGFTPYVEDSTGPTPIITVAPASPGADRTPTWEFSVDTGASTTCTVELGFLVLVADEPCSSPYTLDLAGEPDGTYKLTLAATDAAGNGPASVTGDYVLDSTAPDAPEISGIAPTSPANDNNPVFSGSAEAGSTVRLFLDSECATTAGATGTAAAF
jgi:hypothetical protein